MKENVSEKCNGAIAGQEQCNGRCLVKTIFLNIVLLVLLIINAIAFVQFLSMAAGMVESLDFIAEILITGCCLALFLLLVYVAKGFRKYKGKFLQHTVRSVAEYLHHDGRCTVKSVLKKIVLIVFGVANVMALILILLMIGIILDDRVDGQGLRRMGLIYNSYTDILYFGAALAFSFMAVWGGLKRIKQNSIAGYILFGLPFSIAVTLTWFYFVCQLKLTCLQNMLFN